MGYEHIEHLYKHPEFFKDFTQAYALEKIHGTSTWISFKNTAQISFEQNDTISINDFSLTFHSGGEKSESFIALFDQEFLRKELFQIITKNKWFEIRIHGEAYGGKQQKMAETYGSKLKFIVFDVKINGECFLNITESENIAKELILDFVHYEIGPCDPKWFDQQTKMHSIQAIKNGMGEDKLREGIIVRPIIETVNFANKRIIYKHKNPEFWEIASDRPLGEKLVVMNDVYQIANEWITKQRIEHVINHIISEREKKEIELKDICLLVKRIIDDVKREAEGEIEWSIGAEKEMKKRAGFMFKNMIDEL